MKYLEKKDAVSMLTNIYRDLQMLTNIYRDLQRVSSIV
jgi:hypothetical protein